MSIAAQSIGYEAALKHHYQSVRARLTPPPPRKRIIIQERREGPTVETNDQKRRRAKAQKKVAEQRGAAVDMPLVVIGEPLDMLARPSWRFMLHLVAKKHYLAPQDITGKLRFAKIVRARQEAVWLVATHCRLATGDKLSLSDVGRFFKMDHSTVLHTLRKMRRILGASGVDNSDSLEKSPRKRDSVSAATRKDLPSPPVAALKQEPPCRAVLPCQHER